MLKETAQLRELMAEALSKKSAGEAFKRANSIEELDVILQLPNVVSMDVHCRYDDAWFLQVVYLPAAKIFKI